MRKTNVICCVLILVLGWGHKAYTQDTAKAPETPKAPEPPAHFYHLEFVVQETGADGKPTNSRTYSGAVSTSRSDHTFSVRTGSRIPVVTGGSAVAGPSGENKNMPTQFQYVDVGVNIDVRDAQEQGERLALNLVADISSLANSPSPAGAGSPIIRQNRWQAAALVPIGKPTVVFTSDILDNKGGMQVVVTATQVK